jgi:hypothetical protein
MTLGVREECGKLIPKLALGGWCIRKGPQPLLYLKGLNVSNEHIASTRSDVRLKVVHVELTVVGDRPTSV